MDEMSWWHTQKAVIGAWKHYMTEEYTPAKLRAMYSIGAPPSKKAKPTPPPQPHSPLHPPPEVHAAGLDWTGLDWTGLDWTGLDWTGLGWTGLDWAGLD